MLNKFENTILQMVNISKSFGGIRALKNVTFNCKLGEVHCLVGENGAGKSTLMKILSGAIPYPNYEGTISLKEKEVKFYNTKHSEENAVAIIYQELNLIQEMQVAENIFLGREIKKGFMLNKQVMQQQAKAVLQMLGSDINPDLKIKSLSLGRQQLVEIAKALSLQAKILVLDEPTSALSEAETKILFEVIKKLKEQGVTLIYISHKLDEIFKIADRITVLRDGETVGTFTSQEVNKEKLVALMVGREVENIYPEEKKEVGEVVLEVKNYSVNHPFLPGEKIVNDISFRVCAGEIVGIAGLMGSGRSELLAGIFGAFAKDSSGEIFINKKNIKINSPVVAIKNGIGYLTEDRKNFGLVFTMSVLENLTLAGLNKVSVGQLINKKKEKETVNTYIDEIKIKTASVNTLIGTLSGGNQQKVLLSRCLVNQPLILLLDEPTRGVDVGAKIEIYQIIYKLAKQGAAVVFVSSELPEVLGLSDRILVMREGEIKKEFLQSEATQEKIMEVATAKN